MLTDTASPDVADSESAQTMMERTVDRVGAAGVTDRIWTEARYGRFGGIVADFRPFPVERPLHLARSDKSAYVIVPVSGTAIIQAGGSCIVVSAGAALLLARCDRTASLRCGNGQSSGLILRLPRTLLQRQASAILDEPRRLAGKEFLFPSRPLSSLLGEIVAMLRQDEQNIATPVSSTRAATLEHEVVCGLISALQELGLADDIFPIAGSLQRAIRCMRDEKMSVASMEELACAAGITMATLRRNFRECLGISPSAYLRQERLKWVREKLGDPCEMRTIAQLAHACGFAGSVPFSRAYQRCFGETPSQTRARIFSMTHR